MTLASTTTRLLGRSPLVAAVLYLATVGVFLAAAGAALLNIVNHVQAVQETSDTLEQLRARQIRPASVQVAGAETNPFLEGATLTIASATLLQRVSGAITRAGGSIQSSQVDIATGGKDGIVSLLINCELEQPALQKLLFDLEAGSPLLLIDQIDIQTPNSSTTNDGVNQLRISLNVSGRWHAAK